MNALVVDTSSWVSYFKGKENHDLDLALREGRVYLSPIVAAELLSAKLSNDNRKKIKEFLNELPLCGSELDHWLKVGDLRSKLSERGLSVSTPDAHIAQCALDLDCYLLSEDGIFEKIVKHTPLRLMPKN